MYGENSQIPLHDILLYAAIQITKILIILIKTVISQLENNEPLPRTDDFLLRNLMTTQLELPNRSFLYELNGCIIPIEILLVLEMFWYLKY